MLNLSKFSTKTTTHPKIQEIATYHLIACIVRFNEYSNFLTNKRSTELVTDYYGKTYSNDEILSAIKKYSFKYDFIDEKRNTI